MKRLVTLFAAASLSACATVNSGDIETLKPTIELFHQRARWKDFRGASELIVDERRSTFVKERLKTNDDRDLYITNFELEDAEVAPDTLSAVVVTRISWYRLPSSSEQTAVISNVFVWRDGAWKLESQDEGPFVELKPAPKPPTRPEPPAARPTGPAGKSKP